MTIDQIKEYRSEVRAGRAFAKIGHKLHKILRVNPVRVVVQSKYGAGAFGVEAGMIEVVTVTPVVIR